MNICLKNGKPQLSITVARGSEVMGYLVIDSTVGSKSCGGVRIMPDIDEVEIQGLARAMTLKFGFLGLPQGGAKAGVRGDPEASQQERRQRLAAFARAISPLLLHRGYIPAPDMGTDLMDIQNMLGAVGLRVKTRDLPSRRSGYYTAVSVFTGVKQAMGHLRRKLSECSVAIEGFGKVGRALGTMLASANARVVAISTSRGAIFNRNGLDMKRLNLIAGQAGSKVVDSYEDAESIDLHELLELPVDLLCPCARHESLHAGNMDRIQARIICPGANNPFTPEAERRLFGRGVLCLPFFVTNCGGILGSTMEFASVTKDKIETFIDRHIGERIGRFLIEAAKQGLPPSEIVMPLALRRFDQVQQNAAHPSPFGRLFGVALKLYRRGFIPGPFVGPLSMSYFKRSLA